MAPLQPCAFLAAILSVIVLCPAAVSAQALRKDPKNGQQTVSGQELFRQHCASCHFAEATAQKIGPGLKGLYSRLKFSDGTKVSDAGLTRWIEVGGENMPGFSETLKPEQVRALISYVKTL